MSRLPDVRRCQEWAEEMLSYALAAGAQAAEVLVRDGSELEVKVRLGEPELIKEAGSRRARAAASCAITGGRYLQLGLRTRGHAAVRARSVELCEKNWPSRTPWPTCPSGNEMAREVRDPILGRTALSPTRPRPCVCPAGRAGGAGARSPRDQFRWRGRGSRDGRDRLCQLSRFSGGYRGTKPLAGGGAGVRRCRRQETQRSLLDGFAASLRGCSTLSWSDWSSPADPGQAGIAQDCQPSAVPAVFAPEAGAARALLGHCGCDFGRSRVAARAYLGRA